MLTCLVSKGVIGMEKIQRLRVVFVRGGDEVLVHLYFEMKDLLSTGLENLCCIASWASYEGEIDHGWIDLCTMKTEIENMCLHLRTDQNTSI